MQDPPTSRIDGQKIHKFEHRVRWDYLVLALLGLIVVYKIGPILAEARQDDESEI